MSKLYQALLLACFLAGASVGYAYYVNNYRVWQDLAADAQAYAQARR
jgi:hypothetical protein